MQQPGDLGVFLRNRALLDVERDIPLDYGACLLAAVNGSPVLQAAAQAALDTAGYPAGPGKTTTDDAPTRAGASKVGRAVLSQVAWNADPNQPGEAELRWQGEGVQPVWTALDYGDILTLTPDLAGALKGPATPDNPLKEKDQCMLLHVAAMLLRLRKKHRPSAAAVQEMALTLRNSATAMTQQALRVLGPPPDVATQAEADARIFFHDFEHRDHNKDYRTLAACPLPELRDVLVNILRLDAHGCVLQEALVGVDCAGDPAKAGWLLIH
jgi:hypothetical protein